jgi:hypothetical protein
MKILAVGDIHNGPNLQQIEAAISAHAADVTIFLGDYFDQWNDTPDDVRRIAEWLQASLQRPNRVHLWGNHDLPYALLGNCPGWSQQKQEAVQAVIPPNGWGKLKLWYMFETYLFSHAGFSRYHSCIPRRAASLPRYLQKLEREAWEALQLGEAHWVWAAGKRRGGPADCGGPLWCDLSEFESIDCVSQVFGHTPLKQPARIPGLYGENWCIDVSSPRGVTQALAIDNNGVHLAPIEV